MKSLLIVGADRLGNIPSRLEEYGIEELHHFNGRKVQMVRKDVPNVDAILILTDFINHNLAKIMKQKAKAKNVPILFAKRSWGSIERAIQFAI